MKPRRGTPSHPDWPITWEMFLGQLDRRADDLADVHDYNHDRIRTGLRAWVEANAAVIRDQCEFEPERITEAVIEAAVEDAGLYWFDDLPRVRFRIPIRSEEDLLRIVREVLAARPTRLDYEIEARITTLNRAGHIQPRLDPLRCKHLAAILMAAPRGPSQPGLLGSPANPVAPPAAATPASATATAPAPKPAAKPVLKKERTYDPLMRALARDTRVTDAVRLTYHDVLPELLGNPTEPWGHLWKTHDEVAVLTRKSAVTIRRHFKLLIECGYMRVEGKHANKYASTHYVVARGDVPLPKRYDKDKVGIPEGYNGPPGLKGLEGQ